MKTLKSQIHFYQITFSSVFYWVKKASRESAFSSPGPNILIPVSDSKQEEARVGVNHFPAVVLLVNMSVWAWPERAPV